MYDTSSHNDKKSKEILQQVIFEMPRPVIHSEIKLDIEKVSRAERIGAPHRSRRGKVFPPRGESHNEVLYCDGNCAPSVA